MKKLIITGDWNGEPIYREESPEETLLRELQESGLNVSKVELDSLPIIK
jgi:hypothetical protein